MRSSTVLLALGPAAVIGQAALWGQCGGNGYTGPTTCVSGSYCRKQSEWYSQCVPGSSPEQPPATTIVTSVVPSATSNPPPTGGLDAKIKAKGKAFFGTATDQGLLQNAQNVAVIKAQFGQLTHENSLKWETVERTRGMFSWTQADAVFDFAKANNMVIRGHTLVWHSQLPSWVSAITSKTELTQVIENHINTIVTRYKGRVTHWDVVNEVFAEGGSMRDSVFSRVLGEVFIGIAFRAARAADPAAKLYINDYNLDKVDYAKVTTGMINHVNKWVAAGVPIDGIGSQAHLAATNGWNNAAGFAPALKKLATANVKEVAITELDIDKAAANDYSIAITACVTEPKCVGVTVWGVRDTDLWRASTTPLLFDANYQPKAAYTAVSNALN